jgi:NitT/TauT family transport system permease protein
MNVLARQWPALWLWHNRYAAVFGACILAAWEIGARLGALKPNIYPPLSWVLWSLYERSDLLILHGWLTFSQTILGFGIAAIVGITIGWIIGKSPRMHDAFYPSIVILQVLPKEALAPLLILWFGAGVLSKMMLVILISFFPVVINTVIGLKSLDENTRRYAASLSCGGWKLFRSVEIPSALPSIFTGLKIGVTLAVVGAVVAEIVAGRDGLGYLLLFASSRLDMSFSLGILLVLALWGALLFGAILLAERFAVFWR